MSLTFSAVPTSSSLTAWLADQFRRLSAYLRNPTPTTITLSVLGAEPSKPINGMIVYADGTAWDPGSGAGVYARVSGAWTKL